MLLRPRFNDFKIILFYTGKILLGIGLCMFIPFFLALLLREWNPATDFLIGIMASLVVGYTLMVLFYTTADMNWLQGMVAVSVSWVLAVIVSAIPLFLSGHWMSFLDACFDTTSGYATTGLALVSDLDHLSMSHNMWRHLTMFIGGQGIVVIALTFLFRGASGAFKLYAGEAREEKILPNVIATARFIWLLSLVYLVLGSAALTFIAWLDGIHPLRAFLHSVMIFMAGWDTGGFTPQSQSVLYYHSLLYEIVIIVIMVLGAVNFKLHYAIWTGNRREIYKNIETVTFFITITLTFAIVACGLVKFNAYPDAVGLFRKGFYQLISGHTGTGYMTIYARQFINEWGALALVGLMAAMGLGGCACSTAGGIKLLRVGLLFKTLKHEIKKFLFSETAVVVEKFHHITSMALDDKLVRSSLFVTLCYIGLYFLGALAGIWLGYPVLDSVFESVSAAANVGLSCGVTSSSMPPALKVVYMFQMWIGRLEFMSIFVLIGFTVSVVRGK